MSNEKLMYDFTKIKLQDIEGNELIDTAFHKSLANIIYLKTQNLDLVDKAMTINRGEVVELTPNLLKEVKRVILDDANGVSAFARKAFKDYIDGKRISD